MHPLFVRVKNIMLEPRAEWPLIATESDASKLHLLRYVAVLAAIPAVAGFIGSSFVGVSVSVGRFHDPILWGLLKAAVSYGFSFVIVYLAALAIDVMAPLFGARRNFANAQKLSIYSFTPVWLIGVVLVFPGLRFLTLLGLYALRLLWTGLPPLMGVPRNKVLAYAFAITVAALIIVFAMAVIQAAITTLPFRR